MSAIMVKEVTEQEVFDEIEKYMEGHYAKNNRHGEYIFEHYVDYRDSVSDYTIKKAIENAEKYRTKGELPDYRQSFDEVIWDTYAVYDSYEESELRSEISNHLEELGYEDFDNELDNFITDQCAWYLPERFLNRDVCVNIMIDSGNWNGDCVADDVLNWDSQYYGRDEDGNIIIPKESSLLWLAKQQGKESELRKAIEIINRNRDLEDEHGSIPDDLSEDADYKYEPLPDDKFVKSCIQEWENLSSHMGTMTFLVTMPLFDFFELKRRVNGERDRRRDDRGYAVSTEKDLEIETVDSITIDKSVMCGLFSPWGGAGSVLEVACEKDVEIPLSILFDVSMDGEKTYGYDVNEVYGLVGSAWDAEVELKFADYALEDKSTIQN